jgi:hypothetical protein
VRNRLHVWMIVPRAATVGLSRDSLRSWGGAFASKREAEQHLATFSDGLRAELGIAYCALELLAWPCR